MFPASIHPALDTGLLGLYQKCTHLGCRVPWCSSSSQFECPCPAGEYRSGPAPRGLDLFPLVFEHGRVAIDTGTPVRGLAHGESPSGDAPTGPTCI
jgi:cytochrome b6-f complex iron-sulfur subunit